MDNKKSKYYYVIIAIVVIIVVIAFIVSLGKVSPGPLSIIPEEFKDTKEEAKRRHKRLTDLLEKQLLLKKKLDRIFKRTYFIVRFGLVAIWCGMITIFYFLGFIQNLGDALNFSQASILVLLALNFLTFGTITEFKNYINLIRTKTENAVYNKYLNLPVKIEANKNELVALEKEIEIPKQVSTPHLNS